MLYRGQLIYNFSSLFKKKMNNIKAMVLVCQKEYKLEINVITKGENTTIKMVKIFKRDSFPLIFSMEVIINVYVNLFVAKIIKSPEFIVRKT